MMNDALMIAEICRLRLTQRAAFLETGLPDTPQAESAFETDDDVVNLQATLDASAGPRAGLVAQFNLSDAELALLDLCVAVQVDPALEALVAQCQGKPWRPAPTEALARRLFALPTGPIVRPTGALARWQMVTALPEASGAAPGYRACARITDWYFGTASLCEGLVDRCTIPAAQLSPDWDLAGDLQVLQSLLATGVPTRVCLVGSQDDGRDALALALCEGLGLAPLFVAGAGLSPADFARLQRFTALTGRVPVWTSAPNWPGFRSPVPLQFVLTDTALAPAAPYFDYVMPTPALTPALRAAYWGALTDHSALPAVLRQASVAELRRLAPLAGTGDMVTQFLTQRALSDLETVGQVKRAALNWSDMVLPDAVTAALQDYAAEAQLQANLLGDANVRRLFAADAAPTALFTGPPGVGKTMAAECIAGAMGVPLLVIDVSRTISKYIGETAKNLSTIMERARRFGCIVFFDEADAFFAKRTETKDSNDRHANADTNHLLQLIEGYEGPVILSTNKPGNIDEAFFRRIRHVIDFHRPDQQQRTQLWAHFTAVLTGAPVRPALRPAMDICAARFEMSPAQIKGAALTAHFAAQRSGQDLQADHLLQGIARELRKDGRSMPADLVLPQEPEVTHVA